MFCEIQFQFSIDLRAVAYKQCKLKPPGGGFGGYSQIEYYKSGKVSIATQNDHQPSRTLVQLISIKSGSKAEFRDCSFRCAKVYQKKTQISARSTAGGQHPQGSNTNLQRMRIDRSSNSIKKNNDYAQQNSYKNNVSGGAHSKTNKQMADSISVGGAGLSEHKDNDSVSVNHLRGETNSQSGKILGRYFANEKEEE